MSSNAFSLINMAAFSEGKGAPKGGKSWFAVESKTFEISIEEIRGKLRGGYFGKKQRLLFLDKIW